jgi:hypothetical protein
MREKRLVWRLILGVTLFFLMGGVISCMETADSFRVWIDFPREGSVLPPGTAVSVISHAYAPEGVAEMLLLVDGVAYRRDPPVEPGAPFTRVEQEWFPEGEGVYTLQVVAYDTGGETGRPAIVTVRVAGEAEPEPAETSLPTAAAATDEPLPTDTLRPTSTPAPTSPAPPTATPTVVPLPTETPVPTAPPDTTAPAIPAPAVPADGLDLSCRASQNLVWVPVEDPGGVSYYVKLQRQVTVDEWHAVRGWGPLSGKEIEVDVDCGIFYRWAVRAEDGAGNQSAWSEWSYFSVLMD